MLRHSAEQQVPNCGVIAGSTGWVESFADLRVLDCDSFGVVQARKVQVDVLLVGRLDRHPLLTHDYVLAMLEVHQIIAQPEEVEQSLERFPTQIEGGRDL